VEIEPSLYAADFSRLGEQVEDLCRCGCRIFHFDVGDGHFVEPVTMGPIVLKDVADVEVEDPAAAAAEVLDLLAQAREVRRVERRLDLHRPDPVPPGHRSPGSYDARRRATKNPLVRSRCGRVSRNSGRAGCAYCGHSSPSGSGASPEASTTASFSSRFSVQTE